MEVIVLTGPSFVEVMLTKKYNLDISEESIEKNVSRLTNQVWKLIPMRENEEDWEKQLDTVLVEIVGLNELFFSPNFLQILAKLEGLRSEEIEFGIYRKTVFECISLLKGFCEE